MKEESRIEELPLAFDGPVAAPDHHKIVFENDRMRIVGFRVPPGETVPLHTHRWPTVNYVISLSDFLSYDRDGNLKHDSRDAESTQREGGVFCLPAFPALHSVENVGSREIRGVAVELKD